jgi:hypothetical protein
MPKYKELSLAEKKALEIYEFILGTTYLPLKELKDEEILKAFLILIRKKFKQFRSDI